MRISRKRKRLPRRLTAGNPCGRVFGVVVYVLCHFYRRGFLGGEPPRASIWRQSCMIVIFSTALDFSTNARNDNGYARFYTVISTGVRTIVRTQWRNPPRKRYVFVCASKSSLPGDCHVAALLAMTVALRVFAWSVIRVRVSSFLLRGISRR